MSMKSLARIITLVGAVASVAQEAVAQEGKDSEDLASAISPEAAHAAAEGGKVPIRIHLETPEEALESHNGGLAAVEEVTKAATTEFFSSLAEYIPEATAMEYSTFENSNADDTGDLGSEITINRTYKYNPMIAAEATKEGLEILKNIPNVEMIELETPDQAFLMDSVDVIDAPEAWNIEGSDGTGYAIAVLDSGIDQDHPFFANKILHDEAACFRRDKGCPNGATEMRGRGAAESSKFHGTHVAGIAAGAVAQHNGKRISGVAPGAMIVPINVFSQNGSYPSDQVAALEHVLTLKTRAENPVAIVAVNMSLGGGEYTSECGNENRTNGRTLSIRQLLSVETATVVAAGNAGYRDAVSAPACIGDAVTVSSVRKDSTLWTGHNRSELTDLLAPGVRILSAAPGSNYQEASGTSMAAPHIAGAIAVISAAVPTASIAEIIKALIESGVEIYEPGPEDANRKYVLADLDNAIRFLRPVQENIAALNKVQADLPPLQSLAGHPVLDGEGLEIAVFAGIETGDCILDLGFVETGKALVEVPCHSLIVPRAGDVLISELSAEFIYELAKFSPSEILPEVDGTDTTASE